MKSRSKKLGVVGLVAAALLSVAWRQTDGLARDIGVGANGAVWVIGTNPVPGGFGIYRWNGQNWDSVPGGAVRIAVDRQGAPWVVNSSNVIYRWAGGGWQQLPGAAYDVGVGANNVAWVIGTNPTPGGFGIYRWNGQNWDSVPGGAVRISVDPAGRAWVVNSSNQIFAP